MLFSTVSGLSQDFSGIVGKTYYNKSDLPELKGYKSQGWGVIQQDYVIHSLKGGNSRLIIFARLVKDEFATKYLVHDYLVEPNETDDKFIVFQRCRKDGRYDDKIIAKVVSGDKEYFDEIIKAWQVNMDKLKIESIPIEKIDCENLAWGL